MTITLKDKSYTDEEIIKCLITCEKVISKNAYLEKKWKNSQIYEGVSNADQYTYIREEWMNYRNKLRSLLLYKYSMKEIIQKTKSSTEKATQKQVKEIISFMD